MSQIGQITREELRTTPQDIIRLYHNEYVRRWKHQHKDRVNAYKREAYKRNTTKTNGVNTNNTKKETPTKQSNTPIKNEGNNLNNIFQDNNKKEVYNDFN